ncbi:hypothetical protein ABH922_005573 [Rhodococcus sp. 27YEA15]|uniref:hypothetical protein n=1 Tax=Rhodococcus sp. 27YEA15 TaxID=3156259 RepID=UPI003C7D18CD
MSRLTAQTRATATGSTGQASPCRSSVPAWRQDVTSEEVPAGLIARLTSKLSEAFTEAGIGPVHVSHSGTKVLVEFPESDFLLVVHRGDITGLFDTTVIACVRAPAPDLSTWWSQWKLEGDMSSIAELHFSELVLNRRKLLDMLEEHQRENGETIV